MAIFLLRLLVISSYNLLATEPHLLGPYSSEPMKCFRNIMNSKHVSMLAEVEILTCMPSSLVLTIQLDAKILQRL
ncbi:hypothetical protein PPACK8108_LOCUS16384 [Phakopsora pachyrhizi]|uniref:Secreted protein n=1 Tax=Phakopsora pachyrhizi TaxID=170000 RepID=A0AAV0B807_PHAPC|nr:hypothetical protein PPACK8108_LOCUS16384 [Phakopsora pachyrhizi]